MIDYKLYDATGKCILSLFDTFLDSKNTFEPHTHHFLEISFVKTGTGTYKIENNTYSLMAGDVMIINNSELHGIVMEEGEYLINTVIHFEPEFIWNTLNIDMDYRFLQIFYEKGDGMYNQLDRNNPATNEIFNSLLEIENEFLYKRNAYELMIKAKMLKIFATIVRFYDYVSDINIKTMFNEDKINMDSVLRFIDNNINENIKLNDLANLACMSPNYFCSMFKKFNGLSPFEYIKRKRVQKAIEYIKTTNKSITEIATICGFNTSTNFNKSFKQVTGKAPSYYRSQNNILI